MSVKDQLNKYMEANNYNRADLSRLSGVPYTTIDGLFKKGDANCKLSTLKKLARLLSCSLDELVGIDERNNNFSVYEKLLIDKYRLLDDANKTTLMFSADVLLASQKEKEKENAAKSSA